MAGAHRSEAESEARRLHAKLAAASDRSDLMLALVYPKLERAAENEELQRVDAELASMKANGPPGSPKKKARKQ